jgi:hypothetical protein
MDMRHGGGNMNERGLIGAGCLVLGALPLLSGCVAPLLMAPSLAVSGGGLYGINAYTKHVMTESERQGATAAAVGNDLNLREIKVSKAVKDGDIVRWTADTAIGRYSCSQMVGRVHATCVKQGAALATTRRSNP